MAITARLANRVYTTPAGQPRVYINDIYHHLPYGTKLYLYPSGSTFEVGYRSTSCRFSRQDAWDAADDALNAAGLSYGDSWDNVVTAATGTARRQESEYVPNSADLAALADF